MRHPGAGPEREGFGEASLGDAQSSDPPLDPEMLFDDADAIDGPQEDADLFLGEDDDLLAEDDDLLGDAR